MPEFDALEPIAVIGMAARVPGASDVEEFWRNLLDGVESVTRFDRDEQLARGASEADLDDPSWVPAAPVLEKFDHFDAELFGMTEQEARLADPQHRLLLETVHAALENAGCDPARYAGEIGLFCGAGGNQYHWEYLAEDAQLWAAHRGSLAVAVGNSPSYLATMASYKLNLRGPSLAVHTACSTSLVAIHLACESLRNGECDAALAGGVSVELPHGVGYRGSDGFLSADGHCRPFDAEAGGTLWGSGVGVVMLKRLADAIADGDTVRAVVLGSAVNNDGSAKVGFSAPSVSGQQRVVQHALDAAAIDPRTIGYVEAHGTGTALGDPIEVRALTRAYAQDTADVGWCGLGTVKANIGHLSQAAGVIGFIKAALTVERGLIPPTINVEEPTPAIDFDATPFRLVTSVAGWPAEGWPRRAAVSSFGIGGTNAHAILEQPPARPARNASGRPQVVRLSAGSPEALRESAQRLSAHLAGPGAGLSLDDVAYTLGVGRAEHPHRAFAVATGTAEAAAALTDRKRLKSSVANGQREVAFLLSGQGSQYAGMAAELYRDEPAFRDAISSLQADDVLRETEERLRQTRYAQPALFAVEYALARMWESWGVTPSALLGHSIGEYVAATLAGVFTPADAMRLVTARGELMQQLPPGAMLAVQLDEADVVGLLPEPMSVAAVNGPGTCVVAGPVDAVAYFAEKLKADGIGSRALRTSHAFHSAMTEPILDEYARIVAAVPRHSPTIPFVSNVTGEWITAADAVDPAYWARHVRRPVRFGDGLRTLLATEPVLLECGPGRQLAGLARLQTGRDAVPPLHSLPGVGERSGDLETLAQTAGALWAAGVPVAGDALGGTGRRLPLPGYAYQRKRYWVTPGRQPVARRPAERLPLSAWFAAPVWRQHASTPSTVPANAVVLSGGPRGDALAEALGVTVTREETVPEGQSTIVHALALDTDDECYFSAVRLVQAIAAEDATDRVRVVLVSRSAEDVLGGDLTRPQHATLAGISRVAPLELPGLTVRRIDVDESVPAGALAAEIGRADLPEVALRGSRRWSRAYEQVTLPMDGGPLRTGGRYLITGGLGGIGLTLAEDLAVRSQARIILIGRSAPASHAVAAIGRMEAAGAQVITVAADVTDPQALHLVRQKAQAAFGGLDGIVHAAGVPGGAMLEVADPAAGRAVFGPKVAGTRALQEVFGDLELDFVALCSSVTAVAGALGQADYCAANAFLDAYARSTHGWRTKVVSLNWGGWSEVGMAAQTPAPAALAALREAGEPLAHPMLTTRGDGECSGVLSPQTHWVLDEHRVGGVPVVPGTAHLEAARAAVTALLPSPGDGHVLELRDVTFLRPVRVDGPPIRYSVTVAADGEFTIHDGGAGAAVTGSARWIPANPAAFDAAVADRCTTLEEVADSHSGLVQFGPRWAALAEHRSGSGEELALLRAPEAARDDVRRWTLHPALLDVATAYGRRRGEGSYLPLGYGRVVVHAPLPAEFRSHLRHRDDGSGSEVLAADLTLADLDGRVLVEIEDFVLRRVDPATVTAPAAPLAPAKPAADAISPAEGADAFRRALASGETQLVIHPRTVEELLERRVTLPGSAPRAELPSEPMSDLETTIAAVWRHVLGVEVIDVDDDFFALGGNSLVAVQLIAQTRTATGVRVPMRSLFDAPTVAGQAAVAAKLLAAGSVPQAAAPTVSTTIPRLPR